MAAALKTSEPSNERRTRIADASLVLLARHGARGLTHRAVDAALELPAGSTSYYYRTRSALLQAAAERLLELDLADIARISNDLAGVAALVESWLRPSARARSLARMELLLTAARDPELKFMAQARKRFIDRAVQAQTGDAAEARSRATSLVALVDGLLLHGLVASPLSSGEVLRILNRLGHTRRREPAAEHKPKRKRKRSAG